VKILYKVNQDRRLGEGSLSQKTIKHQLSNLAHKPLSPTYQTTFKVSPSLYILPNMKSFALAALTLLSAASAAPLETRQTSTEFDVTGFNAGCVPHSSEC
jgi:hypothetical protein